MKDIKPLFPIMFLLLLACNNPESILPKPEGGWQFSRWTEELTVDGGFIYEQDSIGAGQLVFEENGIMTWLDVDSTSQNFSWNYDRSANEMRIDDWRFETALGATTIQQTGFTFEILDSQSKEQLWRATSQRTVFNPFTQDSGQAVITIQWKLDRD